MDVEERIFDNWKFRSLVPRDDSRLQEMDYRCPNIPGITIFAVAAVRENGKLKIENAPETWNLKPETEYFQLSTLNSQLSTLNSQLSTLNSHQSLITNH